MHGPGPPCVSHPQQWTDLDDRLTEIFRRISKSLFALPNGGSSLPVLQKLLHREIQRAGGTQELSVLTNVKKKRKTVPFDKPRA